MGHQFGLKLMMLQIRSQRGLHFSLWSLVVLMTLTQCPGNAAYADERGDFFETNIRPLLLDRCVECHGGTKQENGVRLDRRNDLLQGKASDAPLVVPGNPAESRIAKVLEHSKDDISMPPSKKLSDAEIAAVQKWIADGAVWPESSDLETEARRRAEKWREHWAFQPVQSPDLSSVHEGQHPVDFFIDQALAQKNLERSQPASAKVLVRRLSFALTGLPPEFADLTAAEQAEAAGQLSEWKSAYVDRLLASPQYGERWGRYWLDVSRYSDTKGYVFMEDREYPDAWRYREWVVNSLNNDMPYDEFLKRQLAADRMPGSEDPAQLAAMGYLTLGRRFLNNTPDIIDDRIDVVSRGMLGLTASCARCHDHKFDPIPTADYYSLYGVFASSDEPKNEPSTLRLVDRPQPVEPVIFVRGQPHNHGPQVPRRFFTALSGPNAEPFKDGSGRLELANAIASPANPLAGRVAVNRIWMHLLGKGLVDSPSDFGVRTSPPTHPELLDYLTDFFVKHGWSQKALIRHIVMSNTWQQKSDRRPDAEKADPENRLYARMYRSRLDFEAQRDAVLAVSGKMDRTIGGKSADISADPNILRRTIYARIDRQNLPGLFRTFDLPNPDNHAPRRFETTVPQQALFQLNNPFVMNRAVDVAEQTKDVSATDGPGARIRQMFLHVLQREPSTTELTELTAFVKEIEAKQDIGGGLPGWSYGYGTFDEASKSLTAFTIFPFAGEGKWQGGKDLPDAKLGWATLNKSGGHAGHGLSFCAVRRWTSEVDCRVAVNGVIGHEQEMGDGVRLRVVNSRLGILQDVVAENVTSPVAVAPFDIRAGESIDFVVDCRVDESHDSFRSKFMITQSADGKVLRGWNSEDDFRDQPGASRLDAWAQLAQALLLTNEFVFVD